MGTVTTKTKEIVLGFPPGEEFESKQIQNLIGVEADSKLNIISAAINGLIADGAVVRVSEKRAKPSIYRRALANEVTTVDVDDKILEALVRTVEENVLLRAENKALKEENDQLRKTQATITSKKVQIDKLRKLGVSI